MITSLTDGAASAALLTTHAAASLLRVLLVEDRATDAAMIAG